MIRGSFEKRWESGKRLELHRAKAVRLRAREEEETGRPSGGINEPIDLSIQPNTAPVLTPSRPPQPHQWAKGMSSSVHLHGAQVQRERGGWRVDRLIGAEASRP